MKIVDIEISKIKPYERNPRRNDNAVDAVCESIKQCSYVAPIIIDENNTILAGHTRYKALIKLGYAHCECIVKDGLSEEQKKKYRLLDNKTNELADWDFDLLTNELAELDFGGFDFGFAKDEPLALDLDEEQRDRELDDEKTAHCPKCGFIFRL